MENFRESQRPWLLASGLLLLTFGPLGAHAALVTAKSAAMPEIEAAQAALAGINNHGRNQEQPYVTAGDRTYLIGTQDGAFPDMGGHIKGEMGGLWLPPIKLIDAFQARVVEPGAAGETLVSNAAQMVTYPYGSLFKYGRVLDALDVERFQFSPDHQAGMIVQYRFKNLSNRRRTLHVRFDVKTDLRPTWYADHLGIVDAADVVKWRPERGVFIARDTHNDWFCVWGAVPAAGAHPVESPQPLPTAGRGVTASSEHVVTVEANATSTLTFVIAGSSSSQREAIDVYDNLAKHYSDLLAQKSAHYRSIIERARIEIPDKPLQEVYDWARINMEWLVRDVPGVGRGLSGGFMEYPWWFGTETYSLQAATMSGQFELAKQTLRLLRRQSDRANGNGRIAHEITPNGQVVNPGNTQETAQFVMTVGTVLNWTGDLDFAREMYPGVKSGIAWLLAQMKGKPFPQGYGIMEVLNLNAGVIDSAVYTQQALEAAARIAGMLNDTQAKAQYEDLAAQLKDRINERFWIDSQGTYADMYGSRSEAVSAVEGAMEQLRLGQSTANDGGLREKYARLKQNYLATPEGDRAWITSKNWVIATPLETGIAPRTRAISLLDQIRREDTGEFGPYLSAIERRWMMTISTGVQAVAEAQYGRMDQALWYADRIVSTFNRVTPGSMSEMMPDQGCFAIAWTSYGIVVPLIEHVFGIRPDAVRKTITFEPHLPTGWEDISVKDLPVGDNSISVSRTRTDKGLVYDFNATKDGWDFAFKDHPSPGARYVLNGRPISPAGPVLHLQGRKNRLLIEGPPSG